MKESLQMNPIIAAVRTREELYQALRSSVEVVFLLAGNICELPQVVSLAHKAGKLIAVHIDLIEGVGRDYYALKHLSKTAPVDGIISTKPGMIKHARELGIFAIQRLFILDSVSFDDVLKCGASANPPDAIEILPGIIPRVIAELRAKVSCPIITGGIVRTKQDAIDNLKAGAIGISTSNQALWDS